MNPRALVAARIVAQHHQPLSRATARQIKQVVPRYKVIDDSVLERNISTLFKGIHGLLERNDDSGLVALIRDTAHMRTLAGFDGADLIMASMCFLTIIRRALLERVHPAEEALRVYDAVESISIPMFGKMARMFERLGQDSLITATDEDVRSLLGAPPDPMEFEDLGLPDR